MKKSLILLAALLFGSVAWAASPPNACPTGQLKLISVDDLITYSYTDASKNIWYYDYPTSLPWQPFKNRQSLVVSANAAKLQSNQWGNIFCDYGNAGPSSTDFVLWLPNPNLCDDISCVNPDPFSNPPSNPHWPIQ